MDGRRLPALLLLTGLGLLSADLAHAQKSAPVVPLEALPPQITTTEVVTLPTVENPYAGDLLTRTNLTGDWWGARTALADRGVKLDLFATQFYGAWPAAGGSRRSTSAGGWTTC